MTITRAVIGAAVAGLLGAPSLMAQRGDGPPADSNIFARPVLVARLRPRVLGDNLEGAISPDGKTYAYLEADQGSSRLLLRDVATGRTRSLSRHQSHWGISWSPDSKRIAIHGGDDEDTAPSGIWVIGVDGIFAKLVFAESRYDVAFDFGWMRDGRIVFSHLSDSMDGTVMLSVVDPATGESHLLTTTPTIMRDVRLSPDGTQLAYVGRCRSDSDWGVRILALADSARPSLSRCIMDVPSTRALVWSPDAQSIYVLASDGKVGVRPFAVNIASGVKTPIDIAGVSGEITVMSIAADGQLILSAKTASKRIGVVPASGGVPGVLQRDTLMIVSSPVWSNDGAHVGAIGGESDHLSGRARGVLSIAVNAADGERGVLVQRAFTPDSVSLFAVSPDGHCAVQSVRSFDETVVVEPISARGPTFPREVDGYGDMSLSGGDPASHATLWSPDGRFIVKQAWGKLYRADRDPTPGTCRTTGPSRRIELENFQGQPIGWTISADGKWLAFGRVPKAGLGAGLFVVDSHGGHVRELRSLPNDNSFGGPQWSADGRALYFTEMDSARIYRVLRRTMATGAIDTITRGPMGAMDPRLSPDGRTLAVTLAEADVMLWRLSPLRAPRSTAMANVPLRAPDAQEKPDSVLLDLATRIAKHGTTLEKLWPGYWSRTQPYALVGAEGRGVLFVGTQPAFVGFQKVPNIAGLAAPLGAYWNPRKIEHPDALHVPFVLTDAPPAASASSAARAQWRERTLLDLFHGTPESAAGLMFEERWMFRPDIPRPDKFVFSACVTGLAESCVAVQELEQRVLNAALAAPADRLKELVRSYVALRWIRRATGNDAMKTFVGLSPYLARRAAAYVAGSDTSGYLRTFTDANAASAPANEEPWAREIRKFENGSTAVLVLLDRLGVQWRPAVQRKEEPFHVLMRAVSFDSAQSLAIAKKAHVQFKLGELLVRAARPTPAIRTAPLDDESPIRARAFYYKLLAQALVQDSLTLRILPPFRGRGILDTSKTRITFTAGPGDSVSNDRGFVMLPDPQSFVIETPAYRVAVSHVPVVIDPTPGDTPGWEVRVYLPASVMQQLRFTSRTPAGESRGTPAQHYSGANYDLVIKPEAYVDRVNGSTFIELSQPLPVRVRR